MFVLFNKNLNRYFKHPKIGVWWTPEKEEADKLLAATKEFVIQFGLPELADGLTVVEISEDLREIQNENQASKVLRSEAIHGMS